MESKVVPAEIEAVLKAILEQPPEEAVGTVVAVAHRAAVALHGLANREAKSRKGTSEWAKWARLANTARALVLQSASCRDAAKGL